MRVARPAPAIAAGAYAARGSPAAFSGRRVRRLARSIARRKPGASLRRRGSRMAGAQPPRHVVRRTQRDSDRRRRRPRRPPRFGRRAGRGPAGQKQVLSSISPQRVSSRAWRAGATPACQVKRTRCRSAKPEFAYFLPAPALAIASLQPSLRSAACDFMHSPTVPRPGLTSAQSFLASALQALPTAAARMIAT